MRKRKTDRKYSDKLNRELTTKQRQMLNCIQVFVAMHGATPSLDELAEMAGMDDHSSVSSVLKYLRKKGYLKEKTGRKGRYLDLTSKVKKNHLIYVNDTICILNPKWRMSVEDVEQLIVDLTAAMANLKEYALDVSALVDTDDILPARVATEALEPQGAQIPSQTCQPPPDQEAPAQPVPESPVPEPCSYPHPSSVSQSEDSQPLSTARLVRQVTSGP